MDEAALREAMVEVGERLWSRGLVGATEGNLSARLTKGRFLCTPSGISKGHLGSGDLVMLDPSGNPIEGREPSTEIRMHLRLYARRPDCGAVVHAHPPIATGFALAGEPIPDGFLPEASVVLGPVALVPFAMPGTDDVPDAMEPLLNLHKTFLLANHGAVAMGADLWDAYNRMETLERIAHILFVSRLLATPKPLPAEAAKVFRERYLHGRLD